MLLSSKEALTVLGLTVLMEEIRFLLVIYLLLVERGVEFRVLHLPGRCATT
jgi:hypothetical protein